MAAQKHNHVPNVTSYHLRKTINFAHEFFVINAEYNQVGSFFSAPILACTDFGLRRFWPAQILACADFGLRRFWPVPILACANFGLHQFWPAQILACADFGLRRLC